MGKAPARDDATLSKGEVIILSRDAMFELLHMLQGCPGHAVEVPHPTSDRWRDNWALDQQQRAGNSVSTRDKFLHFCNTCIPRQTH